MNFMKVLEKANDVEQKIQSARYIASLGTDIESLKRARKDFCRDIKANGGKMTKNYIVDSSNAILDRYCRKYGIYYRCVRFDHALTILDRAINDMRSLAFSKGAEEVLKRQFKMRF